jgi:hypothetical protein
VNKLLFDFNMSVNNGNISGHPVQNVSKQKRERGKKLFRSKQHTKCYFKKLDKSYSIIAKSQAEAG